MKDSSAVSSTVETPARQQTELPPGRATPVAAPSLNHTSSQSPSPPALTWDQVCACDLIMLAKKTHCVAYECKQHKTGDVAAILFLILVNT